ncbi:MAG TPA: O-antigen ligase family protein [Burkholderiaceae bacterium]|nr:O-antigen ligase family protein [Burkholderiaceae bacterium]
MSARPRIIVRGGVAAAPRRAAPAKQRSGPMSGLMGLSVWLMLALMTFPPGFDYLATIDKQNIANPVTRGLWLAILALALVTIATNAHETLRVGRNLNGGFVAFVALATASVLWSANPSATLTRDFRIGSMIAVAYAFALVGWHPRRFQNVVRWGLTLLLGGSIVFVLGWPEIAVHQENQPELIGAWHGFAMQKNGLGAMAAVACVMWLQGWLARDVKTPAALLGGGISLVCLVNSRSSTSLVSMLIATMFLFTLLRTPPVMRRYMKYYIALIAVLVVGYTLEVLRIVPGIGVLLTPVAMLTGKDVNFTGRADIWAIIEDHIKLHPFLGTGYGAYWVGPDPGSDSYIFLSAMQGFYPGSSHNGYLDVLNDLGIVGLLVLVAYLVIYLRDSVRMVAFDRGQGALFLALFLQQAFANLSEAHWLQGTSLNFVVMTVATFALARALDDARRQRR